MLNKNGIKINSIFFDFVNQEIMPGTGLKPDKFWDSFAKIVGRLATKNKFLLNERDVIQKKINNWHKENKDLQDNKVKYIKFLHSINYIVKEKEDFKINTSNVDKEISEIAGPQLVVPVDNARYALNAANARWGSLYNALYGTDAIDAKKSITYDPIKGEKVISYVRDLLDKVAKINGSSWKNITKIKIENNNLTLYQGTNKYLLADKSKFIGFNGELDSPRSFLIKNNNLHLDIIIDSKSEIGKIDKANISDVIVESAISTIMDNEDSVAAVDAEDKIKCYKNWLGIMKGTLETQVEKNGKKFTRKLNDNRFYKDPFGKKFDLHGRSLLLIRNVGHLMTNPAIILSDGSEIPEGIMDAFFTVMCALHDFKIKKNSRAGSVYIVKPKMHGPDEVAFTNEIFNNVEDIYELKRNTIKVGIMDEERRTTINLKECIRQVKDRIVFINTGFLDRTGDEMHTSSEAGPMVFKGEMKKSIWLGAYENWNVDIGLSCGFSGKAQIGKGMWAMPDKMADMMKQKISHPESGANCAWVPSPTAATLHSTHYHLIDVFKKQDEIKSRKKAQLENILKVPVADRPNWSKEDINKEIENNSQSILGYVVRWINQGVGCSKVPDINNIGLMEDRATLRISSQHIANWIRHDVCNKEQVIEILKKMAKVVDDQNKNDPAYERMSDNYNNSIAFKAACDLVLKGLEQPSGYTEPLLHKRRLEKKLNH
tara:strand:+ start:1407 stop:3545 length:2139 start_codon:yes stop_codon:yes gene_type:complete